MSEGSICTSFLLSFASVKCFLIFEGHFSSMKLAAVLTELRVQRICFSLFSRALTIGDVVLFWCFAGVYCLCCVPLIVFRNFL